MRDQEIIGLWEAYHQVYAPQEITEEVEIAAQYFYEMGLNEDGVDILIEDLGVEEFADWVYEIAEDYTLTEARRGPGGTKVRIEPVTAKGQKFKSGKPTGKSLERLRAQKAARREAETSSSAAKPSGLTASLKGQSAIAYAQKKQSEKSGSPKGIAGRIGAALGGAVKKVKSDIELTKKTAQTVGKAVGTGIEALNMASDTRLARQARVVTHRGVKRHTRALSAAGGALGKTLGASTARRRAQHEEVEAWIDSLIEEGYDLSDYTWDDMCEMYLDEGAAEEVELVEKLRRYDRDEPLPGSGRTPRHKMQTKRDQHAARVMLGNPALGRSPRNDPEADSYRSRASMIDRVIDSQNRGEEPRDDEGRKNLIKAARRPRAPYERQDNRPGGLRAGNTKAGGHRTLVRLEEFDLFYEDQMLNGKKLTKSGKDPANMRTWNKLVKKYGPEPLTNPRTPSGSNTRSASMVSSQTPKTPIKRRTTNLGDVQIREDIFDVILEYLVAEGYADTNKAALAIMANMSEEWKQDIVEARYEEGQSKEEKQRIRTERSGLTGPNANNQRRGEHRERDERNKDLSDLRQGKKTNSSYFSYLP